MVKTGKLNLVDLAGSENIGRSGSVEKRAQEAGNINQSLLTLGRVITSLVERAPHIPYRESKLTRLLQDSLGGRTKTSIIATISPAQCNIEESLSTLDYAYRAKNITNRPEINQKLSKKVLLKDYIEEIERLRRDLMATRDRNGVFLATENYEEMERRMEEQAKEITEKIALIKTLRETCNELKMKVNSTESNLQETSLALKSAVCDLKISRRNCDEKEFLLNKHLDTERKLGSEAKTLLDVVKNSSSDVYKLQDKLDRKRNVEDNNAIISNEFCDRMTSNLSAVKEKVTVFSHEQLHFNIGMASSLDEHYENLDEKFLNHQNITENFSQTIEMIAGLILENASSVKSFSDTWAKEHTEQTRLITNEVMSTVRLLVEQQLIPHVKCLLQNVNGMNQEFNNFKKQMNDKLKENIDSIGIFLSNQESSFCKLKGSVNNIKTSATQNLQSCRTLNSNVQQYLEVHQKEMYGYLNELIEKMKKSQTNLIESSGKDSELSNMLLESSSLYIEDKTAVILSDLDKLADGVRGQKSKNKEFEKNKSETLENHMQVNIVSNANNFKVEEVDSLKDDLVQVCQFVSQQKESIENQSCCTSTWNQEVVKQFDDLHLECDHFHKDDLIKDVPTGETPQRRVFTYPKILSATSPHERSLHRYRLMQNSGPDSNEVDSSIPSTSSEERQKERNKRKLLHLEERAEESKVKGRKLKGQQKGSY